MAEENYQRLYEQEKKKVAVLEEELQKYQTDPSKRGYFALIRVVNEQIDQLNSFKIKSEIDADPKTAKKYERVTEIFNSLPKTLVTLDELKKTLQITPIDEAKAETGYVGGNFIDTFITGKAKLNGAGN